MIIQQDWSTEQAVAVVELLGDLQEVICRHYQPQIQEFMRQDRDAEPNASGVIHDDDVLDVFWNPMQDGLNLPLHAVAGNDDSDVVFLKVGSGWHLKWTIYFG